MEIIVELEAKCQSYDIEVEKLTAENGKIKVKKRFVFQWNMISKKGIFVWVNTRASQK